MPYRQTLQEVPHLEHELHVSPHTCGSSLKSIHSPVVFHPVISIRQPTPENGNPSIATLTLRPIDVDLYIGVCMHSRVFANAAETVVAHPRLTFIPGILEPAVFRSLPGHFESQRLAAPGVVVVDPCSAGFVL